MVPVPCASTASTSSAQRPALGQRLANHPLLGGAVGRRQAVAGPVLVDGAAAHERQHLVPVPARLGEALEHHQADALAEAGAVGRRGERLAAPVGARPRWRLNSTNTTGLDITVTPPASASEHSS